MHAEIGAVYAYVLCSDCSQRSCVDKPEDKLGPQYHTCTYATYELSLVLASGSPLVLESGGFNINLGTGIVNNSGALEFDTSITYNFTANQHIVCVYFWHNSL